jgi:hypothetical protein
VTAPLSCRLFDGWNETRQNERRWTELRDSPQ